MRCTVIWDEHDAQYCTYVLRTSSFYGFDRDLLHFLQNNTYLLNKLRRLMDWFKCHFDSDFKRGFSVVFSSSC